MTSVPTPGVDRENPWPGLDSFTEDISHFFFGRDEESAELFRLVKRETLTILFGQSGLGKTSLIQAGLFPRLRQANFVPVYVRLGHSPGTLALADQVKKALNDLIKAGEIDATPPPEIGSPQTLWEYFHSKDVEFWTVKNHPATPVLVFDQFEEIFTLGKLSDAARARGEEFLTQLADLIENRMPASLRQSVEEGRADADKFRFDQPGCKVLLALREDYLPDLEGLRQRIRSVMQNRMRIRRMNGAQALDVVMKGGAGLVTEEVARQIVQHVSVDSSSLESSSGHHFEANLAELEIEPALLSIFCQQLNNKRIDEHQSQITLDLLTASGREILFDFYQRSVEDLPESMRIFVEDRLLTPSGFRDSVALENAILEPGVTRELLERLVKRRLLRIEDRAGGQRVELTHDVLAQPIRTSRDHRQQRLALVKAAERVAAARDHLNQVRRRVMAYIAVLGFLVCGPLLIYALRQDHRATEDSRKARESAKLAQASEAQATASAGLAAKSLKLADQLLADYYALKIQLAEQESPPAAAVAELLFRRAAAQRMFDHSDLVRLLLPSFPFEPEASIPFGRRASSLSYSPDGNLLAAVADHKAWLINVITGRYQALAVSQLSGKAIVKSICFQPSTELLAIRVSDQPDDVIIRWDCAANQEQLPRWHLRWPAEVSTGKTPAASKTNRPVQRTGEFNPDADMPFVFDPDGYTLAAAGANGKIGIFNVGAPQGPSTRSADLASKATTQPVGTSSTPSLGIDYYSGLATVSTQANTNFVHSLAYTQMGRVLVSQASTSTDYWNSQTLEPISSDTVDSSWEVASTDSQPAVGVVSGPDEQKFCIWNASQSNLTEPQFKPAESLERDSSRDQSLTLPSPPQSAAYSPDGQWLVVGTRDGGVQIVNENFFRIGQSLPVTADSIDTLAFRPDASGFAGVDSRGVIRFWRQADPEYAPAHYIGRTQSISSASPDGRWFTSTSYRNITVFETATGRSVAMYPIPQGTANGTAVDNDGAVTQLVQADDGTSTVWSFPAKSVWAIPDSSKLHGKRLSDDGKLLAVLYADDRTGVYDLQSHKLLAGNAGTTRPATFPQAAQSDPSAAMAISHDHRWLALLNHTSRSISVIEASSGKAIGSNLTLPGTDNIRCIEFSGDDRLILCGTAAGIQCIDPKDGNQVYALNLGVDMSVLSASRDQCVLAYGGDLLIVPDSLRSGPEEIQHLAGWKLNGHNNAVRVSGADSEEEYSSSSHCPPASQAYIAFWPAWGESKRRLLLLENGSGPVFPIALEYVNGPLRVFFSHAGDAPLPAQAYLARAALQVMDELPTATSDDAVDATLAWLGSEGTTTQILLLQQLQQHLPPKSSRRANVLSALACDWAARVQNIQWPENDPTNEKNKELDEAFSDLKQVVALKYTQWGPVRDAFGDLHKDPRFPPQAMATDDLISQANDLNGSGADPAKANLLIDMAIERGVHTWRAFEIQGFAREGTAQYTQAFDAFQAAMQQASDDGQKSQSCSELSHCTRMIGGDMNKALDLASKAFQLAPAGSRQAALVQRAYAYFGLGDYANGLSDVDRITSLAPDDPEAWAWKGQILIDSDRSSLWAGAIDAYGMALKVGGEQKASPDRMHAFRRMHAWCNITAGRFADALVDVDALRAQDPNDNDAAAYGGILYAEQGRLEEAVDEFNKAISGTYRDAYTFARRAEALLELGRAKEARADFQSALDRMPSDDSSVIVDFFDDLCDPSVGLQASAQKRLQQCTDAPSKTLALFSFKSGDPTTALKLLKQSVNFQPRTDADFRFRAIRRAYLGQFTLAEEDARHAFDNDPGNPWQAYACALVYLFRSSPLPGQPPTTQEDAGQRATDVNRALFYLGEWSFNDMTRFGLLHSSDFDSVRGDPTFQQLETVVQKQDDRPDRAFERARFFAQVYRRLKASTGVEKETGLCLDAALSELERASGLGLDPAKLANGDFAVIRDQPRFANLMHPAPATQPGALPTTDPN